MFDEDEEREVRNSIDEGEDYHPHDNRQVENPITFLDSIMHILKCSLSTGLLAMPQGFSMVGYGSGMIGTVVGGLMVTHCLHVLINSQYRQCQRLRLPMLSYQDTISTALSHGPPNFRQCACPLGISVIIFLLALQLGTCCVIIVFVAHSLKKVLDGVYILSIEGHMVSLILPCIACNLQADLKTMAPVSMAGNVLFILGFIVFAYVVKIVPRPNNEPLKPFNQMYNFPPFFGSILYSLTAVGVVVAVENDMLMPKQFTSKYGVLNLSMTFLIIAHLVVGMVGYNFCRENCEDSMSLDMPSDYWLANVCILMFATSLLLSFGLNCYVPVQLVWGFIEHELPLETPLKKRKLLMNIVRVGLCLFTFLMALVVPSLSLFISLFGSLCLSALALIFPAILEALGSNSRVVRIKDYCMVLLGLIIMILGFYNALDAIVMNFMD